MQCRPWTYSLVASLLALSSIACWLFYARLHWPTMRAHDVGRYWILDTLHGAAMLLALISLVGAVVALVKGPRWAGLVSLLLAIGACLVASVIM